MKTLATAVRSQVVAVPAVGLVDATAGELSDGANRQTRIFVFLETAAISVQLPSVTAATGLPVQHSVVVQWPSYQCSGN